MKFIELFMCLALSINNFVNMWDFEGEGFYKDGKYFNYYQLFIILNNFYYR